MILHWPQGIDEAQRGTLRHQFINVADVVPTLYELLGLSPPAVLGGRTQLPVTGHSFATVLADPDAPATNRLQYFENAGSRGLVVERDGRWWKAVTRLLEGTPFDEDLWELYDLDADPSECNAGTHRDGTPITQQRTSSRWPSGHPDPQDRLGEASRTGRETSNPVAVDRFRPRA